jgi:hypothetical protein
MRNEWKGIMRFAGTLHHSAYETPFRIQNGLPGVNTPLELVGKPNRSE